MQYVLFSYYVWVLFGVSTSLVDIWNRPASVVVLVGSPNVTHLVGLLSEMLRFSCYFILELLERCFSRWLSYSSLRCLPWNSCALLLISALILLPNMEPIYLNFFFFSLSWSFFPVWLGVQEFRAMGLTFWTFWGQKPMFRIEHFIVQRIKVAIHSL